MELWMPDQITLDATSLALMQDVEETARKVRDYRPLPAEVVRRIEDDLLPERVYSSNAIEGNTLDLRETEAILKAGAIITQKRREAREVLNLGEAVRLATQWQRDKTFGQTKEKFLEIHAILLRDIKDEWAGRFRSVDVMINGAKYQPPDHTLVPSLSQRVFDYLNAPTDDTPLLRATWAHWAIARIHPFMDGNGRMARLWQDALLLQNELTCAVIRPEDRREYLNVLTYADDGDFNPIFQLISRRLLSTFDKYLSQIGNLIDEEEWLEEVVDHVESKADQEKLEYVQWSRMMERLKWEFELAASRVTQASKDIKIQIQTANRIDQVEWDNIRGKRAEGKDYFIVNFSYLGRHTQYPFRLMTHSWTNEDSEKEKAQIRVALVFDYEQNILRRNLFFMGVSLPLPRSPITLWEVFTIDQSYVRISHSDPPYERDIPAHRIAREFLTEVIKYEMQKF